LLENSKGKKIRFMNILCLSIDGLHSGMIGAYGNTWIDTPTLDSLACQSVVFDQFYTESMKLPVIFDTLWQNLPIDCHKILLTDDSDVFYHEKANQFSARHRLEWIDEPVQAQSLEETQFFKSLATVVDIVSDRKRTPLPFYLWAHFGGFRSGWDFPAEYREKHRDEKDPPPYKKTKPPRIFSTEIDPDKIQSVMETYSGGIAVLDDALAGLLESLEEGELGGKTLFILLSTRGFSLGEHNYIGINNTLLGENIHLPLFVRFPDGFGASVRIPALFQPKDLAEFLNDLSNTESPMFKLIREEVETIHETLLIKGKNESALVTPDWFLRKFSDGSHELYVKPDDRWEINDVTDRCPEIIEELSAQKSK
jgi:arylsulfatase A-like enzyme